MLKESQREAKHLFNNHSPSPFKERGIQGVRSITTIFLCVQQLASKMGNMI